MNTTLGDSNLVIQYIQQRLKENYNSDIKISSQYYKTFDMNYGMTHYIAKYLDYTYPLLDLTSVEEYNNISENYNNPPYITEQRELTKPISILNYFLSNNKGGKLCYNPSYTYYIQDGQVISKSKIESAVYQKDQPGCSKDNGTVLVGPSYDDIYNKYMRVEMIRPKDTAATSTVEEPNWYDDYLIANDLPLFTYKTDDTYEIKNNVIFNLQPWERDKEICEIDNLVAGYLLGRVIGPNSSREEVYYAQKLLIQDRNIPENEKGIWCPDGAEGTYRDMTQIVINYQKQRVNPSSTRTLFVTGYFDVPTEAQILKDLGDTTYGILGL